MVLVQLNLKHFLMKSLVHFVWHKLINTHVYFENVHLI